MLWLLVNKSRGGKKSKLTGWLMVLYRFSVGWLPNFASEDLRVFTVSWLDAWKPTEKQGVATCQQKTIEEPDGKVVFVSNHWSPCGLDASVLSRVLPSLGQCYSCTSKFTYIQKCFYFLIEFLMFIYYVFFFTFLSNGPLLLKCAHHSDLSLPTLPFFCSI